MSNKSNQGCLIALAVLGACGLVMAVVVGVLVYKVLNSPEAKKAIEVAKAGIEMQTQAIQAPGTDALRDAGCKEAMVVDPSQFQQLVEELDQAAPPAEPDENSPPMVICQVERKSAIDCDQVAEVYLGAVPSPETSFIVQVQEIGFGAKPRCDGQYDKDGQKLDSMDKSPESEP